VKVDRSPKRSTAIRNFEEVASTWESGALVLIFSTATNAAPLIRPAAFVYAARGGFAWVEPSYADPSDASSPSPLIRTGELRQKGEGFVVFEPDAWIAVHPFDARDPGMAGYGEPLLRFAEHLKKSGLQWHDERERVHGLITPSIKAHEA
jgi:hypothetical protein